MGGSSTTTTTSSQGIKPKGDPAGAPDTCPERLRGVLSGPNTTVLQEGDLLNIELLVEQGDPAPIGAILARTAAIVGTFAGMPQMGTLARCLADGVAYGGIVDRKDGGLVHVTITRR